jgi:hypothetical protein
MPCWNEAQWKTFCEEAIDMIYSSTQEFFIQSTSLSLANMHKRISWPMQIASLLISGAIYSMAFCRSIGADSKLASIARAMIGQYG